MYKIVYIQTGNIFELPAEIAKELKDKYPKEYKIIEKNGKKFNDKSLKKEDNKTLGEIYSQIVEK